MLAQSGSPGWTEFEPLSRGFEISKRIKGRLKAGGRLPIKTVSKMLGHINIKTTQHYAKTLDVKVSQDPSSFSKLFKNKANLPPLEFRKSFN